MLTGKSPTGVLMSAPGGGAAVCAVQAAIMSSIMSELMNLSRVNMKFLMG
jgi:hypothetical protein